MYEVKSNYKQIDNKEIQTWKAEMFSANVLEVEVGTNGYCGGDAGHGSRTYFAINDLGGTAIEPRLIIDKHNNVTGFEVELAGDTELSTFIDSLEFALKVLKEQSNTK